MTDTAAIAGMDFDPWQSLVADTSLEFDPETRLWRRRTVVFVVGRQNGKTEIVKGRVLTGLFVLPEKLILHTAQDRTEPRKAFKQIAEAIEETPALHKRLAKNGIRRANGQEAIELKDGSAYTIVAPREKSFRGPSADLIIFDEVREHRDTELWGAALPTQSARPNPQAWAMSNAGDVDSIQLAELQRRGRHAADFPADDPTFAYFEWSAEPSRESDDPQGWAEANPALGRRITEAAIREELISLSPDKFETERLCRTVLQRGASAIDFGDWIECGGDPDPVEPGLPRPVCGVHINGERTHAALAMVADRDGRLVGDLLEEWHDADGVDLRAIATSVLEWIRAYKVRDLVYDRAASSVIAAAAEAKRVEVHEVNATEFVIASQNLHDAITTRALFHRNNPSLNDQVAAAGRRERSDGSWFISQAESATPIPGVLALAFAVSLTYRPAVKSAIVSARARGL